MENHIMHKIFFLLILLPTFLISQPSGKAPSWDGWQFLIGEWKGEGSGDPGQGTGSFSFWPDLNENIIIRKNHTEYPASKDRPAFSHDDLMIVHKEDDKTRATYFDNEGHVINYIVQFSEDSSSLIFTGDIKPLEPRFRLTYTKVENGEVKINFEIAPPGKSETFTMYLGGVAIRTRCERTENNVESIYEPVEKFDPKRDAQKDIDDAVTEASKSNRRIILDVGGNWCIWCKRLDTLFMKNKDLNEFMHKNYVVVKVNFSKENENEKVLSQYPEIKGYPHMFVLEKDGKLIHSQDTGELESGKGHSREKVFGFLKKWVAK